MVYHLYEDFLTISTDITGSVFSEYMVNLYPIEDGFFSGFYLAAATMFTGVTSDDFYWHRFSHLSILGCYLPSQFSVLGCEIPLVG